MKQSTLNFAAAKRTASSNVGKPKPKDSASTSKPKTSGRPTQKKRDSSDEEPDKYDDIVLLESSEEDVEKVDKEKTVASWPKPRAQGREPEDSSVVSPKTRSETIKAASSSSKSKSGKEGDKKLEQQQQQQPPPPQPFRASNLKLEDLQKKVQANDVDELPELDTSDRKWNKLHRDAKTKLGGVPIHGKDENKVHHILRVFDNSYEYGPCVGMTRLERWERAESLGLNPPKEVFEMLMTKQGRTLDEYKESVFHGEV